MQAFISQVQAAFSLQILLMWVWKDTNIYSHISWKIISGNQVCTYSWPLVGCGHTWFTILA